MKKKSFVTGLVVLAMTAMLSGCGGKKIVRVETSSGGVQHQYDAVSEDSVRVIYSDGSAKNLNELEDYMFNRSDYSEGLTVYVKGQGTFNVELTNYVKADTVTWKYNGTVGLLPSNISMGSVDPSAFSYEFIYSDGFNTSGVPQSVELSADGGNVMSDIVLKNGVTQKVLWGYNQYAVADVQPIGEGNLGSVELPKDNMTSTTEVDEDGNQVIQTSQSDTSSDSYYSNSIAYTEKILADYPDGEYKDLYRVADEMELLEDSSMADADRLSLFAKYWDYSYYVTVDNDYRDFANEYGWSYKTVQDPLGGLNIYVIDMNSAKGSPVDYDISNYVQKLAVIHGLADKVEQVYGLKVKEGVAESVEQYIIDDSITSNTVFTPEL